MDKLQVKQKLLSVKQLPAQPHIVREIIKLWRNPNVSMSEYERIISRDPGLSAEVLKVVNSPFYGLTQRVSNLKIALTMLGLVEIYRIVANSSFYRVFRTMFYKVSYDLNLFWRHCQATANIAYYLATLYLPDKTAEAHIAGLLHDMGKLVMEQFFNEQWQELLLRFEQYKTDSIALEEEIFGLNHSEIGATLLVRWNFPKEIVIPVRYHHDPPATPDFEKLVLISYFAEKIATALLPMDEQHLIREFFIEDKMWLQLSREHPELNILGDKIKLAELKPMLYQSMVLPRKRK